MTNRDEQGRFRKGLIPWNKGLKNPYSEETLKAMSLAKKGKRFLPQYEFKPYQKPWNKGLKGVLKPNKTSFKKGRKLAPEIEQKRLMNLKEKVTIQPSLEMTEDLAYVLGTLLGDGCVYKSNRSYNLCLDVTSKKFAQNFFASLVKIGLNPRMREFWPRGKYSKLKRYCVRTQSLVFGRWYKDLSCDKLASLLTTQESMIGFIRGFYDSEGNLYLRKGYNTPRVSMSNTNLELLYLVKNLSEKIGIKFNFYGPYKNSSSFGYPTKEIYRIATSCIRDGETFLRVVQPNIKKGV